MADRTAYVPVAGTAITAANHLKFPGGWIGYVEVTSGQTGLAGGVDITGLAITVTVGTSRRLRLSASVALQGSVSGDLTRVDILEGATQLASHQGRLETSAVHFHPQCVITPSSGSHTYKVFAIRSSGAGTLQTISSAATPIYLLVEDFGPSS